MNKTEPRSSGSFHLHLRKIFLKKRFIIFLIPAILWFIFANIMLLLPGPDVPDVGFFDFPYSDKLIHAGVFGTMTFLFSYPFLTTYNSTKKLLIYISIACAIYGVLIEYAQKYLVFERDFEYGDMVADAIGCVLAYFVLTMLKRIIERKNTKVFKK